MSPNTMWDRSEEMSKQHDQGSSTWLKLQSDGDKAVVVFLGEPYPRFVVFQDGKYEPFTDKHKGEGIKPSFRVALNVALYDTQEVKVLEQGQVFFKQLLQIRSKRSLAEWAFEVERHGAAKDPRTTYSILPEHKLTPAQQAEFSALPLNDLVQLYGGEDDLDELDSFDRRGDQPVDPRTAQSIVQALKALPREAVDRFCQKFEVQRIRDLPAGQVERARAFVEALEAELRPGPAQDDSVDPFAN